MAAKKKRQIAYTAKSMKELRDRGFLVDKVEQTIPRTFIKKDLFGFIDIIAVCGPRTLAVQSTSYPNISSRSKKIHEEKKDELARVVAAGWEVEIWGWRKKKIGNRLRWAYRVVKCEADHNLVQEYLKLVDSTYVDA
jgi:hypothetical protein